MHVDGRLLSSRQKDGDLLFFCLAGARMVVAGAKKRSTKVNILPQGGIAFLLYSLSVNLCVHMSGVHAAGSPYCEDPRKLESCCDCNCFLDYLRHMCMNRDCPLLPIRSTHGHFKSGQATGRGTATMAVCED